MATKYKLNTGETVQVQEIENFLIEDGANLYTCALYTLLVLSGWSQGYTIRLTDREMVLNGAVRVK